MSHTITVMKLLSKLYSGVPSISAYSKSSEHKWTSNAMSGVQCQSTPWYTEENRKRCDFYFKQRTLIIRWKQRSIKHFTCSTTLVVDFNKLGYTFLIIRFWSPDRAEFFEISTKENSYLSPAGLSKTVILMRIDDF